MFLVLITIASLFVNPCHSYNRVEKEVVYSLILDRFYDGDINNNIPYYAFTNNTKYDQWNKKVLPLIFDSKKTKWNKYWGGDLKGLYSKLEYLKELGITAIIISPIFQNTNGYLTVDGTKPRITAYHGYWLKDLYRLDEHFISKDRTSNLSLYEQGEQLLKKIITKAHSLDLKIILDVNLNHSSPTKDGLNNIAKVREYELQDGAIFKDGEFISARSDYFSKKFGIPEKHENWFHTQPAIVWGEENRKALKETYKKMGYEISSKEPSEYERNNFMLHGLADLNHENKEVQDYLIQAMIKWTKMGVDGYRIDAIRHIPKQFIVDLKKALIKENPNLYLIGEWYDFGESNKEAVSFSKTTGILMFDFEKMRELRDIFIDKTADYSNLKRTISRQDYKSIVFVENQDLPRALSTKKTSYKHYDEMLKLLLTLNATPCIYYGSEQYLHDRSYELGHSSFGTTGGDPWNRDFMRWDIKKHKQLSSYQIINKLSKLRKTNPALSYGKLKIIKTDSSLLAFHRIHQDRHLLYISSINEKDTQIDIKTTLKDGRYIDIISGAEYEILDGHIKTELGPYSSIIISN